MSLLNSRNERIYTLGHLIHNRLYNEHLEELGISSINYEDVESIFNSDPSVPMTLVIRTHGITKEKLEASLAEANTNVEKAQKNVDYWSRYAFVKDKEGKEVLTSNKSIKKGYEKALADLVSAQNLVTTIQESIEMLDKKAADQAKRVASRWFKEAQDYVNSLPAEYKGLMPEESEEREAYFERVGKTVSELNGKIKELDKNSSAAQEVLGGYTTERDYANNIYTKILGGIDETQQKAIEDARKNREDQAKKDEKEREEAAKRLVQAYADALKAEIAKVGSQWNLFKDLLEATGKKVTIRLERGADIDAACGQLAGKQIY
jgi:hypothetical protein